MFMSDKITNCETGLLFVRSLIPNHWRDIGLCAFIAFCGIQSVAAQETSPSQESDIDVQNELRLDNVVVREIRNDDQTTIDRRSYEVVDDPTVQSASALEILGKVPSVSLTISGQILLQGRSDVSVLIDGREVSWNDRTLGLLPASKIQRIEVITNPSAEFAAQSGSIINIITREEESGGLNGQIVASLDSLSGHQINISPNWSNDKLSLSANLGISRTLDENETLRRVFSDATLSELFFERETDFRNVNLPLLANIQASYKKSEQATLSGSYDFYDIDSSGRSSINTMSRTSEDIEAVRKIVLGSGSSARLTYAHRSTSSGRSFVTSISSSQMELNTNIRSNVSAQSNSVFDRQALIDESFNQTTVQWKADYRSDIWSSGKLSLGSSVEHTEQESTYLSQSVSGNTNIEDRDHTFSGERTVSALYATLEHPISDWKILSGLRFERERTESGRLYIATQDSSDWFPSIHLSRKYDDFEFTMSYAGRINRPSLGQLDPSLFFANSREASAGNSNLDPILLSNYEVSTTWKEDDVTYATATIYNRHSNSSWSPVTQISDDNVRVNTWVNAGGHTDIGGEFILAHPLSSRWKYEATINAFERDEAALFGSTEGRARSFYYNGRFKLEYGRKGSDGIISDQGEFLINYIGPRRHLQGETGAYWRADLNYRKALTSDTVIAFSIADIFNSAKPITSLYGDGYFERTTFTPQGTTFKLVLTHKFGG